VSPGYALPGYENNSYKNYSPPAKCFFPYPHTALAQLIRAERRHGILETDGAYTLLVDVKANGTTKVKKNLFVDAKVRRSAGADLTYQLIEGGGVIAQGQELKRYIERQSARDVQKTVSGPGNRRGACQFQDDTGAPDGDRSADRAAGRRPSRRTGGGQLVGFTLGAGPERSITRRVRGSRSQNVKRS